MTILFVRFRFTVGINLDPTKPQIVTTERVRIYEFLNSTQYHFSSNNQVILWLHLRANAADWVLRTKYYQHNLSCNCVSSCISDAKPTSKRQCYAMLDNGVCDDEWDQVQQIRLSISVDKYLSLSSSETVGIFVRTQQFTIRSAFYSQIIFWLVSCWSRDIILSCDWSELRLCGLWWQCWYGRSGGDQCWYWPRDHLSWGWCRVSHCQWSWSCCHRHRLHQITITDFAPKIFNNYSKIFLHTVQ